MDQEAQGPRVDASPANIVGRLLLGVALLASSVTTPAAALPGDPLGSEITINQAGNANRQYPAVASNARGDTVVVWVVYLGGDAAEIRGRLLGTDGAARGNEFLIATPTASGYSGDPVFYTRPAVAIDAEGRFVVTWVDAGASRTVFAQRYAADGQPAEAAVEVRRVSGIFSLATTTVAMNSRGDYVVGWREDQSLFIRSAPPIDERSASFRARRYLASGVASRLFIVDQTREARIVTPEGSIGNGAELATTSMAVGIADDASFAVAWGRYGIVTSHLYTRRYDALGLPGITLPVSERSGAYRDVSLAMTPDGSRHVVAYYAESSNSIEADSTYARAYIGGRADGQPQPACIACVGVDGIPGRPAISISPDGSFVVGTPRNPRRETPAVVVQRFASGGGALGGNVLVAQPAQNPALANDGAGNSTVVWAVNTGRDTADIRARRYAGP
jgi:hypothetical protein